METFNVAIVGGGAGCLAIMDMVTRDRLRQLRMNIMGVADIDSKAPGMRRARDLNIYTTTDYHEFFSFKDLNLILELTRNPELGLAIQREKPEDVRFMDHTVARLFWDFVRMEEEKLSAELEAKEQTNAVNILLKDVITLEEEKREAQREAERLIKAERDYTQNILNNLTDAVCVVNEAYVIENTNITFEDHFRAGDESLIGKPCYETLYNREIVCDQAYCPLSDFSISDKKTLVKDIRYTKNGRTRFYEAAYSPLSDEYGESRRFLINMRDITARKELEMDLQRSQRKYKNLFQNAHEGILLFNRKGGILESNSSLNTMLGYTREQLERMNVSSLVQDTSQKILTNHLDALELMGFVTVELTLENQNGDPLPVEASIVWLPEEEMFLTTVRDIAIRKKLEQSRKRYSEKLEKEVDERTKALKDSQQESLRQKELAEGIIHGSPIPMCVINRDHKVLFWNRACEKMTGIAAQDIIGTDDQWKPFYPQKRPLLADLIMDGDMETIHKLYDDMKLRKSPMVEGAFEAEHYFSHLGKEGTHLYFNAAPIKDDAGIIQGAIVTYQDFSERVNMTQELKRREAFVQNLIENSIDGILATNAQGRIVIFNRGCMNMLGYSPDDMIGKMSYTEILSKETTKKIRSAFYGNGYGPPGKIVNMEVEILNKDHEPNPVRLSGTLLYEHKKEVGSVVFIQDLREILRLQQEKVQAERMAAIGQTMAGLAHYIKNILNGLRGGAYTINSAMKKESIELVANGWKIVEKNIDQITQIVMDMLVYSKERQPHYQPVDPNELVRDVAELMKTRAQESGVAVLPEPTAGLEKVPMDKTAIHRSLLNLIGNAVDACAMDEKPEKSGRVIIKTDRPEGWAVRFQVIDNGMGMDQETQKNIFTGFYSTKGYRGTGLGLPVTLKMVKEHGGELSYESQPGKGTTFTLLLPNRESL